MKQRTLNTRGNIALGASGAVGLFVGTGAVAGGWSAIHTWLSVTLGILAGAAVVCYTLAGRPRRQVSVGGDSPQVTHPAVESSATPSEVRR
ncbi:hypothetical protein [Micromonospora sp. HM5-17]|uniref:hypothetical protein n=1 Tax=Micromonospora sp. HM5-17 TaxID=2487710 RepID=UPI000F474EB4|nr:hypothetical protein [Micromonospora sp. HM5-17]ROT29645.1 hypothetical protein EF879_18545 [Micromonospora sp. HM5-17]